jgi:hypothetical protein
LSVRVPEVCAGLQSARSTDLGICFAMPFSG